MILLACIVCARMKYIQYKDILHKGACSQRPQIGPHHHHHHHIHFRALFSSTEGWAFWQVFLEGVLSTQNDFEGQQNPYLASFCHFQALHPMISLACQIFSVQPHSACILLQSSMCYALHVQTVSSYWCGAPHLSPGCQALWEGSLS